MSLFDGSKNGRVKNQNSRAIKTESGYTGSTSIVPIGIELKAPAVELLLKG